MSPSNLNAEPQFLLGILPKLGVNLLYHYVINRTEFTDRNPEINFFGDGGSRCRIFPLSSEKNLNVVYSERLHQDRTVKVEIESLEGKTVLRLFHPDCVTYRYDINRRGEKQGEDFLNSSQGLKFKYDHGKSLFLPLN